MTRPAAKTNAFSTETKATPDRPQCSRTSPAATEMQKESAATCRPDNAELHELLEFLHDRYNWYGIRRRRPRSDPARLYLARGYRDQRLSRSHDRLG